MCLIDYQYACKIGNISMYFLFFRNAILFNTGFSYLYISILVIIYILILAIFLLYALFFFLVYLNMLCSATNNYYGSTSVVLYQILYLLLLTDLLYFRFVG